MELAFFTIRRTLVMGASGAPLKGVVLNVASSAATPAASNATAASLIGTRFSAGSAVESCAFTIQALHNTTRNAASFFMVVSFEWVFEFSQKLLLANHRIHELVDRLAVFGHALLHPAFKLVTRFFKHARGRAIPIKHVRVQAADIVIGKGVFRHGD